MADNVNSLHPSDLVYRNTTVGVGGATSGANPPGKLWLPIWSGEVIHAYDEYNVFENLVVSRVIPSGTTVEVPITGTVSLNASWDAGEELIGGENATATTFQVKLDKRPMAAHFEIDNVDLMLTQWEFRNELARQAALTLANTRDKQIYSYLIRAATADPFANDPRSSISEAKLDTMLYADDLDSSGNTTKKLNEWGDATQTAANRATGALSALEAVEKFIVDLQELDIPYDQLFLACTPQAFMDIRSLGVARASSDLNSGGRRPYFGGTADMGQLGGPLADAYGQIHDTLEYMGCTIVKSNHVLTSNTSGLGEAKYDMDFGDAKIKAVMWTPEAIAGIRLQGLKVDTVDDVRRNTTFTVASMMSGTGVLRPECAAVITGLSTSEASGGSGTPDIAQERGAIRGSSYLNTPSE